VRVQISSSKPPLLTRRGTGNKQPNPTHTHIPHTTPLATNPRAATTSAIIRRSLSQKSTPCPPLPPPARLLSLLRRVLRRSGPRVPLFLFVHRRQRLLQDTAHVHRQAMLQPYIHFRSPGQDHATAGPTPSTTHPHPDHLWHL
jgi:hypothetical protein